MGVCKWKWSSKNSCDKKQHDSDSTSQPWFDAECIELLEWSILMLKIDTKEKFNYKGG